MIKSIEQAQNHIEAVCSNSAAKVSNLVEQIGSFQYSDVIDAKDLLIAMIENLKAGNEYEPLAPWYSLLIEYSNEMDALNRYMQVRNKGGFIICSMEDAANRKLVSPAGFATDSGVYVEV